MPIVTRASTLLTDQTEDHLSPESDPQHGLIRCATLFAVVAMAIAVVVLSGWAGTVVDTGNTDATWAMLMTMKPWTAILLILIGVSLLLLQAECAWTGHDHLGPYSVTLNGQKGRSESVAQTELTELMKWKHEIEHEEHGEALL